MPEAETTTITTDAPGDDLETLDLTKLREAILKERETTKEYKRLQREAQELRTEKAQREEATRKEIETQATQRGEWEKVAQSKDAELTTLKPQLQTAQEQRDAYAAAMEDQMKARVKALPPELAAMLPDGDVLARYKALGLAEAAAAKLSVARSPGTPAGPTVSGGAQPQPLGLTKDDEERLRSSGRYGRY